MSRSFVGTVVSTKMVSTISVQIEKKFRHPKYQKVITRHKKFLAHYEGKDIKEGDVVEIKETRPISKRKFFYSS